MLTLMVSVGHRCGLFDVMAGMDWADSATIAAVAGRHERYVREWLGAMTTGQIVDYDPGSRRYRLPPEHAASMTRAAGPGNLASYAQFVAMLGKVEDGIVASFRDGGGVPYSQFPEFQRLMAEDSGMIFDATLLDIVLPLVPGLPARLVQGIDVVGCGSGHAINLMAEAYPTSRFVGFDFSAEGVAAGGAEATAKGLSNARFEVRDVATLGGSPDYDLVTTFDSVHDQADPARVLRGIFEMLRPGGTYLCVDVQASSDLADNVDHPSAHFFTPCRACTA
jgi:SAM-dependent methyltransferase